MENLLPPLLFFAFFAGAAIYFRIFLYLKSKRPRKKYITVFSSSARSKLIKFFEDEGVLYESVFRKDDRMKTVTAKISPEMESRMHHELELNSALFIGDMIPGESG